MIDRWKTDGRQTIERQTDRRQTNRDTGDRRRRQTQETDAGDRRRRQTQETDTGDRHRRQKTDMGGTCYIGPERRIDEKYRSLRIKGKIKKFKKI